MRFWIISAVLLGLMAAAIVTSARLEVQTPDESVHLVSGYSIWRQGRFSLNAENPPISKLLCALPLLWLKPDLPPDTGGWQDENGVAISVPFLYRNRLPADQILFWGRLPSMLLTLVFGLALAVWTRYRFGEGAALVALGLFCFDPNFIAHGRYITSDVAGAGFFFAATVAWGEFLVGRRRSLLIAAAVLSAVGICTKLNLLLLPPLFWLMALWHTRRPLWRELAIYLAILPPVIWAIYGFELRTLESDAPIARFLALDSAALHASHTLPQPAIALLDPATRAGRAVHWMAGHVPIPAYSFFKGAYRLFNHTYWGHRAYLLGHISDHGWWYYFPVAFMVKTPTGTLLLLILAAAMARHRKKEPYPLGLLLIPPLFYFAASMFGSINIGLRHLLPIYAFVFVWIGIAVSQSRGRWRAAACAALLLVLIESAHIYPDYLAFFNLPSGGSRKGPTYLLDSNIDWGQDVLKLKRYMEREKLPSIALQYFGSADLAYYHLQYQPFAEALLSGEPIRAAFSVTEWQMHPEFSWLRRCELLERIGYSIYIYDLPLTGCRPAIERTRP